VLRNPVTNVAAMASITDIADWCFVEALGAGAASVRLLAAAVSLRFTSHR
jgi:hypothetical protein